jgi:hypothetical protein
LEYALIYAYVIQRVTPPLYLLAKATCAAIEYLDIGETSVAFGRALVTGPTEDGSDDSGYWMAQAEQACAYLP